MRKTKKVLAKFAMFLAFSNEISTVQKIAVLEGQGNFRGLFEAKAKAKAKDLTFEAKAKAKDLKIIHLCYILWQLSKFKKLLFTGVLCWI